MAQSRLIVGKQAKCGRMGESMENAGFSRRALIAGLAGATLASAGGSAMARRLPRRPFFHRIGKPIGIQLYTLGDQPKADLGATFAQLAAIGYRDVELPQLYGKTATEVRVAAERAGLSISSLHLGLSSMAPGEASGSVTLDSEPQRIADVLGALGARAAVLPIAPLPAGMKPRAGEDFRAMVTRSLAEAGVDHWKRAAAMLNQRGALLRPMGIALGYHNHNVEFAPTGGTTGWEVLMRETDPRLVSFEVDVGWVAAAGLDPVDFLHRHRGRLHWMHMKDLTAQTTPNFALSLAPCEVGSGKQDWARLLPAAQAAGVRHFYVEQEPPFAIPRMDAVARSHAYLAALRA
jgi:sugar phosphate isomerase/epimerase